MSNKKVNYRRKVKEKSPYRKSRAIDSSCRCNGSCDYCRNNRLHKVNRLRVNPGTVEEEFNSLIQEYRENEKELNEYLLGCDPRDTCRGYYTLEELDDLCT